MSDEKFEFIDKVLESVVLESVVPESVVLESVVPESVVPESVVPESVVPESIDSKMNLPDFEQIGKIINCLIDPKMNKNDTISNLLGGFLKSMLKNQPCSESEDSDTEKSSEDSDTEKSSSDSDTEKSSSDSETEKSSSDSETEKSSSGDESDYIEIYLIRENNKTFNYATSYTSAKNTLDTRFHNFLKVNTTPCLRIEKSEDRIKAYERQPNSLNPYDEQLLYEIEMFTIEKY